MIGHLIRRGVQADIDALETLENRSFEGDRLSRRSLKAYLEKPNVDLLVADLKSRLVGYGLLSTRRGSNDARLYSIAVDAAAGRTGVGRALLAACEAAATGRGCLALRLEVRENNEAAAALYRSEGYEVFGRHADYYEDGAAALRFVKRLGP